MRLERGAADGEELPCLEDSGPLAEFFDAVVEGMAVRSIEGASRPSLHRIVDLTMRIWDVGLNTRLWSPLPAASRGDTPPAMYHRSRPSTSPQALASFNEIYSPRSSPG